VSAPVAPTQDQVRTALRAVVFPGFRRDIVTFGMVEEIVVEDGRVGVRLRAGTNRPEVRDQLGAAVRGALGRIKGVAAVEVHFVDAQAGRGRDPSAERAALPGVEHIIAVSSVKGGVGKSTIAVNLAAALASMGHAVGLLDADVYGPSLPIMYGTGSERPQATASKRIHPIERHGVKLISMGFFAGEDTPVIWRGPMVMGLVRQFLRDVEWGRLDFLVIDLPPGTGDAQLTLVQQVPVTGAIIVTTPQDVALLDVGRGIAMFRQLAVPILGVVENMSGYTCPQCGTEDDIFGHGGGAELAARTGVPLLARLPIVPVVREAGDRGVPVVVGEPNHPASQILRQLAARVLEVVGRPQAAASGAST
jgi:ATP-binding protein involved in chromosome partitioning